MGVEGDEALVEFGDIPPPERLQLLRCTASRIFRNAAALNLGKGIYAAANASLYSLFLLSNRRKAASCR